MSVDTTPQHARRDARPPGWSKATIALHWLSAILIVVLLGLGWLMVHADLGAAATFDLYQLHKSLGFVSLAFLLARLAARLVSRAPPATPGWERRLATAAHAAFYLLLFTEALSGWLTASTSLIPIPTRFFDLFVIPNFAGPDAALFSRMSLVHYAIALLLAALLIGHIGAALKHHFIDGDDVLTRMVRLW